MRADRLMLAVVSLLLVTVWPSVGRAIPLSQAVTSGSFVMGTADGHLTAGGFISTPDGDSIFFSVGGFSGGGPTGGFLSAFGFPGLGLVSIAATHAGQTYFPCGFGFPCAFMSEGRFSMHAEPPPFAGNLTVTVPGSYSLDVAASVSGGVNTLFSLSFSRGPLSFSGGPGPASLTFTWHPEFHDWQFVSGSALIVPTPTPIPEPATLVLWGTGAAGLGLARWYRRRARERAHAA